MVLLEPVLQAIFRDGFYVEKLTKFAPGFNRELFLCIIT